MEIYIDTDETLLDMVKTESTGKIVLYNNVVDKIVAIKCRYPDARFHIVTARSKPVSKYEFIGPFAMRVVVDKLCGVVARN